MKKYDAIIIGAGQAGMPLAGKISKKGLKVALIEQDKIGGTCINDGCSPTKTMVASAKIAHMVSRAGEFGIEVPTFRVNQKTIKSRKEGIVDLFRGGAESRLKKEKNISIIKGRGKMLADNLVEITTSTDQILKIQGDKIFINTGSQTVIPEIEGIDKVSYLTSTSIMELEETPEHLIILGGGYIGLEFGQMFRRFGSEVTILDRASRLVPKEDVDVCEEISNVFNRSDIKTIFDATVSKMTEQNGKIILHYNNKSGNHRLSGSHLLIAVGRTPSSSDLGLEALGINLTIKGHIEVNEHYETSIKDVYALGDVAGSPPFTHMAYHDAHLIFDHVYEAKSKSNKDRLEPYCIFIDPQLARIGLNEQQAQEKQISYKVGKFWMKHGGRPLETDEKDGFFKVLVDPNTKQILGATILSMDGGEILAVIQMAMLGGISYEIIKNLPIAHPTLAESLNNLMMDID